MSELAGLVGRELVSGWREVAQERIDLFAEATDDPQWIHVDPERAAQGPFGTTIAHGFLTLSLVVPLFEEALPSLDGYALTVNYGLNRVRFTAPVPVGSRVRGRFRVEAVEPVAGGEQLRVAATIEREGEESRPAWRRRCFASTGISAPRTRDPVCAGPAGVGAAAHARDVPQLRCRPDRRRRGPLPVVQPAPEGRVPELRRARLRGRGGVPFLRRAAQPCGRRRLGRPAVDRGQLLR